MTSLELPIHAATETAPRLPAVLCGTIAPAGYPDKKPGLLETLESRNHFPLTTLDLASIL